MSNHVDFILSPITNILEDVVFANVGIGDGIETYPLCDYVMQSVFLKMTGFQEQKMKCICWELATKDYDYRYLRYTRSPLGECSSYKDKKTVYNDLIDQIKKHSSDFDVSTYINRIDIKTATKDTVVKIFRDKNLSTWAQNNFGEFIKDDTLIQPQHFAGPTNLFENVLQSKYEMLYKHRNRCAHNAFSYQQNLPTLKTLADENYRYDNYFVRFALLILIDKIFLVLYKKHLEILEG